MTVKALSKLTEKEIGELRKFMEKHAMTVNDIAGHLGLSPHSIYGVLSGKETSVSIHKALEYFLLCYNDRVTLPQATLHKVNTLAELFEVSTNQMLEKMVDAFTDNLKAKL